MHQKIKKNEGRPLIIKRILTKIQIKKILNIYNNLPVEINNKRQKIKKKKWISSYEPNLQA